MFLKKYGVSEVLWMNNGSGFLKSFYLETDKITSDGQTKVLFRVSDGFLNLLDFFFTVFENSLSYR